MKQSKREREKTGYQLERVIVNDTGFLAYSVKVLDELLKTPETALDNANDPLEDHVATSVCLAGNVLEEHTHGLDDGNNERSQCQ